LNKESVKLMKNTEVIQCIISNFIINFKS